MKLDRLYEEFEPNFSEEGTNRLGLEELVFKSFCDYLEQCFSAGEALFYTNHFFF